MKKIKLAPWTAFWTYLGLLCMYAKCSGVIYTHLIDKLRKIRKRMSCGTKLESTNASMPVIYAT